MSSSTPPTVHQKSGYSSQQPYSRRERDDDYGGVVLHLDPRWRIITCRKKTQWVIQKKEAAHAGPWRSVSYHMCRSSLIRTCGSLNLLSATVEGQLLDVLPSTFREYAKERPRS